MFEQAQLATASPHTSSKVERERIKKLEKEICRKDNALAETTALLVMTKKLEAIFGSQEDEVL
jgi:transposase